MVGWDFIMSGDHQDSRWISRGARKTRLTMPTPAGNALPAGAVPLSCGFVPADRPGVPYTLSGTMNGDRYSRVSMALASESGPKVSVLGSRVKLRPSR